MSRNRTILRDESGQVFVGYIILLMIIMVVMVNVNGFVTRMRNGSTKRAYQERALDVARQGFEAGLSFFRLQTDGVSLQSCCDLYAPQSQAWASPWPLHPDAAFMPQTNDTDHFNNISMAATNVSYTPAVMNLSFPGGTAMGLVRTFPLGVISSLTLTTASEVKTSPLWGRYVIRRQNTRNWSPGPNTMQAYTDPEAAHDITHMRSAAVPGSGNYWSIVSRGYVIQSPIGVTLSSGLTNTAMYDGACLLSAPKLYYLNRPFLLAKARVYGELYRVNFNDPGAAVWVTRGAAVTCNTNCILQGGLAPGYAVGRPDSSNINLSGGSLSGASLTVTTALAPSISAAFPGMTTTELKRKADYLGGISVFPKDTDSNFSLRATRTTFYYVTVPTSGPDTGIAHFPSGTGNYVMSGTGLVIVEGNLQIDANNLSAFNGIVFVLGNVTLRGPAEIAGTLIATGTVSIGNSADLNKASVYYNSALVSTAKSYLQRFGVVQNSVLATID